MKKAVISLVLFILLALCLFSASAENVFSLGQPFPDFTVTDTEGNVFTLSEALKDHEAVLINIWAAWYWPCKAEIPFLNEAYARYGDRVAFIALSQAADDTLEKIETYRQANGVAYPMGRDEGAALYQYITGDLIPETVDINYGVPETVIVDRFGNAVFEHYGSFISADGVTRTLEAFLGNGYTETVVLTDIPQDTSTRAFPISAPEGAAFSAYVLYVVDQDDKVVPEVSVIFCTDTACVMRQSDETGTISFDGAPGVYHVEIVDAPEGYGYDEDFELYTDAIYSEWVLRIRRD